MECHGVRLINGEKSMSMKWLVVLICAAGWWVMESPGAEEVPADFKAAYVELETLEQKLSENGLELLGRHRVAGSAAHTVVVYTSAALKEAARLPGCGFIGALRILHNSEAQEIVVSNPEYYLRAYLRKAYGEGMAQPVREALTAALGALEPTADLLKKKKLANYHFMISMPYYDDAVCVGTGGTAELLEKLQTRAKDRIVFTQHLAEDGSSVLCGVALPAEIEKFNEKLDTMDRSHLLPYMVLIENGEARILHAKFYLALSFPRLSMTEFMKIMSVPGDIAEAFKADFR
jgi:hypothetical protein